MARPPNDYRKTKFPCRKTRIAGISQSKFVPTVANDLRRKMRGWMRLQICISLTGNYNFFNLQTMFLGLPLFDDAALQKVLPQRLVRLWLQRTQENRPRKAVSFVVGALAL